MTHVIWSANEALAEGAVDSHASVCLHCENVHSVCVCVCVCVYVWERAREHWTIIILLFQLKPPEPTPSWKAVCRSRSRFLLSASPIISQQYCELQSSRKRQLSRLWWPKATSHGMLSQTFGNVSFSLVTVCVGARSIDSAMLSLVHKTFEHMAPCFESKSAEFCFSACATRCKSGFGKFRYKSFGDS